MGFKSQRKRGTSRKKVLLRAFMELIVSNKKREIEKIAGKPEDYDENLKFLENLDERTSVQKRLEELWVLRRLYLSEL